MRRGSANKVPNIALKVMLSIALAGWFALVPAARADSVIMSDRLTSGCRI